MSVVFVGVNDCCFKIDPRESVKHIFANCVTVLFDIGARNFLLMDVPPRMRPSGNPSPSTSYSHHHWKVKMWNKALKARSEEFQAKHPSASVLLFSTWDVFTDIYDNPTQHGLQQKMLIKPMVAKYGWMVFTLHQLCTRYWQTAYTHRWLEW